VCIFARLFYEYKVQNHSIYLKYKSFVKFEMSLFTFQLICTRSLQSLIASIFYSDIQAFIVFYMKTLFSDFNINKDNAE